jgi:Fur family ferric uptake transcriptional regulator
MSKSSTKELKTSGLKVTVPRIKILEIFQARAALHGERHLSAEDIYRILATEQFDVGLATVYRVLTQFEQAGLLSRRNFEAGRSVFELNEGAHHDHLVCVDCGKVEEFLDSQIEERQRLVAEQRGFELQDHALALYATCRRPDCPNRPSE